jgi:Mg/Co/Ni transporter MgtE
MIGLDEETLKSIDEQLEYDFASVRAKMQEVLARLPKFITLKQAHDQINKFNEKSNN